MNIRRGESQTVGHRREGPEGVAKGEGIIKRRGKQLRIIIRSVIKLSSRQRCARTGLSLMDNFADMAINANSLMAILR